MMIRAILAILSCLGSFVVGLIMVGTDKANKSEKAVWIVAYAMTVGINAMVNLL